MAHVQHREDIKYENKPVPEVVIKFALKKIKQRKNVPNHFKRFVARDSEILEEKLYSHIHYTDLGKKYGLCAFRISQIYIKGLRRLHAWIGYYYRNVGSYHK